MIRRIRLRTPVYVSACLLLAGLTLGAQGTQAVTRPEMESFVLMTIGGAGAVMFAAFWILLNALVGRIERTLTKSISEIADNQARGFNALRWHDESPHAHRAASEHNHAPMERKMDHLAERFDALVEECRIGRCAVGHRDPANSPHPRREGDPEEFDGRGLRGRQ